MQVVRKNKLAKLHFLFTVYLFNNSRLLTVNSMFYGICIKKIGLVHLLRAETICFSTGHCEVKYKMRHKLLFNEKVYNSIAMNR